MKFPNGQPIVLPSDPRNASLHNTIAQGRIVLGSATSSVICGLPNGRMLAAVRPDSPQFVRLRWMDPDGSGRFFEVSLTRDVVKMLAHIEAMPPQSAAAGGIVRPA